MRRTEGLTRSRVLTIASIAVGLASLALTTSFADERLSFDDRVRHQRAIEEVYWQHRIWPAENPGPKPALHDVLSDSVIRERVATHLEMSAALEIFWQRPLTGEQLQAELNRIVRRTRKPELLRELFAALDNDPFLVAECLARPVLTRRLLQNWYSRDVRFHGALRERAEAALAARPNDASRLTDLGGAYAETEWRLVAEDPELDGLDPERAGHAVIDLDAGEWNERIEHLAERFEIVREPGRTDSSPALLGKIPMDRLSRLTEENDRFVVTAVLSRERDRLRTATVSWSKRSFTRWWMEEGRTAVESTEVANPVLPPYGGYELGSPFDTICTDDTWAGLWYLPTGRSQHTAVWTGTEMIVWGGFPSSTPDTGGRYDPATDSWTATSTGAGAPTGRYGHSAVWTGTEMIVWGGGYHNGPFVQVNTGGRYNPVTDSWTTTSTGLDVPTARYRHTAVWTGTEMIVWGGDDGGYPNTGGRYDPLTDSWSPTSTGGGAPSPRRYPTAVWSGTEMIVWGGHDQDAYLNTGGRYDPTTDRWTAMSTGAGVPTERYEHAAIWSGTEMIVWGGRFYDQGAFQYPSGGGRYDPATDSWTATSTGGAVPIGRRNPTAVWTGAEMIVWGGFDVDGELSTGGRFDPETDSWASTSTETGAPTNRQFHTAVWTGTEMIVWGGGGGNTNTGGRYDPATDSWIATSAGAGVPAGRSVPSAVWTGTEMIVWGGVDSLYNEYLNTGGKYDPAIHAWTATSLEPGVPTGRYFPAMVWTGTEMIVWSGFAGEVLYSGGRYDPVHDSWAPIPTGSGAPSAGSNSVGVWTGTEMIVWNGIDSGRYDPLFDRWTAVSNENGPAGRYEHSAVWTGTEMIVWGGRNSSDTFDTGGRYDPATDSWTETSTAAGVPSGRHEHTAIWTGTEMIVWGGYRGGTYFNTGGRYDPATDSWVETHSGAGVPSMRTYNATVWTGSEMIVWGGRNSTVGTLGTGGRYDPATDSWTPISTGSGAPRGRINPAAVWTGTEMIIWGGYAGTGPYPTDGGQYCACEGSAVSVWYPDADGDGYGADSTGIPSCGQPPGYIALGGDCDDSHAETYAGAPEINDGLDNQCPGDVGHGLVDEVDGVCGFHDPTDRNEFSWTAQTGATSYEVARSTAPDFSVDCVVTEIATTSWVDPEPVPVGGCHHYLVRSTQPSVGSWGANSSGEERPSVCP